MPATAEERHVAGVGLRVMLEQGPDVDLPEPALLGRVSREVNHFVGVDAGARARPGKGTDQLFHQRAQLPGNEIGLLFG